MIQHSSLLGLLLLSFLSLAAQDAQVFQQDFTIASEAFGDEREITVYFPPKYYRGDTKYNVTYVLDGHYAPFIDLVVKAIEYNVNAREVAPTIIVGIHAKNRGREFSNPKPQDEQQAGRAPALREHLRNEVIPFITEKYPELTDHHTLIGHSSGGTFVLQTVFSEESDLFDAYIGISPALRKGQNTVLADAEKHLGNGAKFPVFLYASTGSVGSREEIFSPALDKLNGILKAHPQHGINWHRDLFEGLGHFSVVAPSVVEGLTALAEELKQ